MMKTRLNTRGETLAETIIALSILAIGVSIASTVILNSMRNMSNSKNRVIAVNIAREGIEAVRGIRDTNWLFYSDRRRQCWNHDPSAGTCDGTNPIPPGTYIAYKFSDQSWRLQLADDPLVDANDDGDFTNDTELAGLSLVDISNTIDSNGDGDPTNDTDFYNHTAPGVLTPLGTEVKTTIFTRYVTIEYLANVPDPLNPPSNISPPDDSINTLTEWNDPLTEEDTLNRIRVTSVVGWQVGGIGHTAILETILTDHLGREDLQS